MSKGLVAARKLLSIKQTQASDSATQADTEPVCKLQASQFYSHTVLQSQSTFLNYALHLSNSQIHLISNS